ncbi:MAG: FixG Ig-like domain-containing protein [Pirellulaceae bacterium]
MVYALSARHGFDARVIRGKGAPFTSVDRGLISNTFSMRLVNRTDSPQSYAFEVLTPKTATLDVFDDSQLELQPGEMSLVPLRVRFPSSLTFGNGNVPLTLLIVDGNQNRHEVSFRLLGPRQ